MKKQNVLIIGASDNPERYSFKAYEMLKKFGHKVTLLNPRLRDINTDKCYPNFQELPMIKFDTVTMYVSPEVSAHMSEDLLNFSKCRFIFNPGSENAELIEALEKRGHEIVEGCTLVMLRTDQF